MLLIFKFVLRDLISILQIMFTLCFFLIVFPGPHERAINVSLKETKFFFQTIRFRGCGSRFEVAQILGIL